MVCINSAQIFVGKERTPKLKGSYRAYFQIVVDGELKISSDYPLSGNKNNTIMFLTMVSEGLRRELLAEGLPCYKLVNSKKYNKNGTVEDLDPLNELELMVLRTGIKTHGGILEVN